MEREAIEDYAFSENMTLDQLVLQMEKAWGFTAGKLAAGVRIMERMMRDDDCVKFLSFTGNLVATGTRGALRELVKRKLVNVIVTTCGTVDHDLARCWKDYYRGSFFMSDAALRRKGTNRLGNVLVPNESYGLPIEEKMQQVLHGLKDEGITEISSRDLCREIGKRVCNESSILYWAAKNDIPVFVPGITDGAVGYQLWLYSQEHEMKLDLLKDSGQLNDIVYDAEESGALLIGGGISKHHTLWWNQFRDGLNYAIYISTADEWDGSLSGARPREAISWGKIHERAKRVMIEGDASLILPLMVGALVGRLGKA